MVKIPELKQYQKEFVNFLTENNLLYFDEGLKLKDERPTDYFVNTAKANNGEKLWVMGTAFAESALQNPVLSEANTWLGPSYKGSPIAISAAMAAKQKYNRDIIIDYDRKEAKTHGDASGGEKLFVMDGIKEAVDTFGMCKALILDDVMSSSETKRVFISDRIYEECKKYGYAIFDPKKDDSSQKENFDVQIIGILVGADREQTTPVYQNPNAPEGQRMPLPVRGEDALEKFTHDLGIPVGSVVGMTDAITYAYQKQLLNKQKEVAVTKQNARDFVEYQKIYGAPRADKSVEFLAKQII